MTDRTELAKRLLTTAKLLLQNAQGCAENHSGHDFATMGEPGWIHDCRTDIERFETADALSSPLPIQDEARLREECAKALYTARPARLLENGIHPIPWEGAPVYLKTEAEDQASIVLNIAMRRLVTVDEEMVERGAKGFYESRKHSKPWGEAFEVDRTMCRNASRQILQAALGPLPKPPQAAIGSRGK